MKRYLFIAIWVFLVIFLITISFTFRDRTEAMVAVVESRVTSISFQRPVIIEDIQVVAGQEVEMGDTLLRVRRPDLTLDIEKKENQLQRLTAQVIQEEQAFGSRRALVEIEKEAKVKRLRIELTELDTKRTRQKAVANRLSERSNPENSTSFYDTLTEMKVRSIQEQIAATLNYAENELQRLRTRFTNEQQVLVKEVELMKKELVALRREYSSLNKIAMFDGIVGTVNVQLDELVQPYTTAISIYERSPTLIKAYMSEKINYSIQPGDHVEVVSENRRYKIGGTVKELGARVVGYPNKIQPLNQSKRYGQEVFIAISADNLFLNGEKVFVYPIIDQ